MKNRHSVGFCHSVLIVFMASWFPDSRFVISDVREAGRMENRQPHRASEEKEKQQSTPADALNGQRALSRRGAPARREGKRTPERFKKPWRARRRQSPRFGQAACAARWTSSIALVNNGR